MVRRLSAVASATALATIVALVGVGGCSSESSGGQAAGDDAGDGGKDRASRARPKPDASFARDEPASSCMAATPIDAAAFPYKPAGITKGACTPDELDALGAFFSARAEKGEDVRISEWAKEVSPGCAACVFSDGSGATWTPILSKRDALDSVDRGGCIEAASGDEACGRAYQQVNECRLAACLPPDEGGVGTCATQGEFEECFKDRGIFTGPCKDAYDAMVDACGEDLGVYEETCSGETFTFEGPIKAMCIDGLGGADAGATSGAGP